MAADLSSVFDDLKTQLNRLEKLKETADRDLKDRLNELKAAEKTLADAKNKHAGLLNEIEAKRDVVERESREAAARIDVGNRQMAELLRVQTELDGRDKDLKAREQSVSKQMADLQSRQQRLEKREQAVKAAEDAINEKIRRFKEAVL